MRLFWTISLAIGSVVALVAIAAIAWLFLYPRGIPDPQSLARFAPKRSAAVSDSCLPGGGVVALPFEALGTNMRRALGVAEGNESDPGILIAYYRGLVHDDIARPWLSYTVARTALCERTGPRTPSNYKLDSLRMSAQLEQHFSGRELFTMLANRLYFGEGQYGVEAASRHYFHKEPNQLSVAEAALIAGLPRSPSYFAPGAHPDLALQRRNQVIDAMVAAHLITDSEGATNKAIPLSISAGGAQ